MKYINPKDWKEKYNSDTTYVLIDIREAYERIDTCVECLHIPMAELVSEVNQLPMDKSCIIMCQSGRRAEAIVNLLETDYNLSNLYILEGGYSALIEN